MSCESDFSFLKQLNNRKCVKVAKNQKSVLSYTNIAYICPIKLYCYEF